MGNSMNSMFPAAGAGINSMNSMNGMNGLSGVTGVTGMASLYQQLSPHTAPAGTASPKPLMNGVNGVKAPSTASPLTAAQIQQQQYLFTTIPNLGSGSNTLSSLANAAMSPASLQQQMMMQSNTNANGTPTSNNALSNVNAQTRIRQSGWGLANGSAQNASNGQGQGLTQNAIPTQNAPQFMQPAMFPRTQ